MWLRTLMVIAVSSLGLDAPDASGFERLARDGRVWCEVQLDRIQGWWGPLTNPAPSIAADATPKATEAPTTTPPMPNGLTAFATQPAMPNGLTAFTGTPALDRSSDEPFASVVEGMVVAFADEARNAAPLDVRADEGLASPARVEGPSTDDLASITDTAQPPRAERLTTALQLTGQAVRAWLGVFQITVSD